MRIAISNIAWNIAEDNEMAGLLSQYSIDAIDIAPSKYFQNIATATSDDIRCVRSFWEKNGIEITGMQSLLFGTEGLNVFGSEESQEKMLVHLSTICRIGHELGAKKLVFGSPKNRLKGGLSSSEAKEIAHNFFSKLGDIAQSHEVSICLEPNPECYGADFMTNSYEAYEVVKSINHDAIKMQLDLGAITINQESIDGVLSLTHNMIGHIHISEPNLSIIGDVGVDHSIYAEAMNKKGIDTPLCIEMLEPKGEPHMEAIDRALKYVVSTYKVSS